MKKLVFLFLVFVLALGSFSAALAETPAPGGPFNSAFRVQNLETTVATCSYTFYDATGNDVITSTPTTVQPGDSLYVYVPSLSLDSGSYSSVVSCDKKIAAVVNFSDANSGASHSGVDTPALVWYAPGIYDNYYNYYSNIVVQNATAAPVSVTVKIYESNNPAAVYESTKSVPGYASVSFEQAGLTELANNVPYSAVISGTGAIAPIVNVYGGAGSVVDNQLYSYNAFASGAQTMYAPIIMNKYYGYDTALVIQNMGAATANVTVTYTQGAPQEYQITPGSPLSLHTPSTAGLPAGNTLYGATIESDQDIVVLVNQSNAFNRAASYTGFAAGGQEVRAPIVEKNYYTYNSSIVCQNVGTAATTMTINYSSSTGNYGPTTSPSIPVGSTHQFYQPGDPVLGTVPNNWIGSATITAAASDIVCVVNQDVAPEYASVIQDSLYSYNGILP